MSSVNDLREWFFTNWGSRISEFHNLQTRLNSRGLFDSTLERISIIKSSVRTLLGDSVIASAVVRRWLRVITAIVDIWIFGFDVRKFNPLFLYSSWKIENNKNNVISQWNYEQSNFDLHFIVRFKIDLCEKVFKYFLRQSSFFFLVRRKSSLNMISFFLVD